VSRRRVVYWNNIPAPYMVERFDAVVGRGNIALEAWFSERTHPDRSWRVDESAWTFPHRFLPRRVPVPLLDPRFRADLLVSLYGAPEFVLGFALARARRLRTAFWSEVTFDAWQPRRRGRETLKRYLFSRVDGVITPGPDGRAFAERYGTPPERIHLAQHAIDVDFFSRPAPRAELGVDGTTYVYVGRLWRGKGLDVLLDAYKRLRDASLVLVGDGDEEPRLRERVARERIENVVFAGFRHREELPAIYAAADVFVFPTLGDPYGLVVDEALAAGLPVVATDATGEIALRVRDGENGLIVAAGDPNALAAAMERAPALHGGGSLRTPDDWAADFERAVEAILAR
jgi:glycosyltransferase involved in cell wall biosynthesis